MMKLVAATAACTMLAACTFGNAAPGAASVQSPSVRRQTFQSSAAVKSSHPTTRGTPTSRNIRWIRFRCVYRSVARQLCIPISVTTRITGSRSSSSQKTRRKCPVQVRVCIAERSWSVPIPPDAPIEGGAHAKATGTCSYCNKMPASYTKWESFPETAARWRAGSGAVFPLNTNKSAAESVGRRPMQRAYRFFPRWSSATKLPPAKSITRCA